MSVTTIQEFSYDHDVYHTIKYSVDETTAAIEARDGATVIFTTLRDCFLRHHVQEQFSVCAIHRHFDLKPSERNVESNGKAMASLDLEGLHASS
jgi:G:T-mismatch repair DNA endonuclease (very short patch repair protein)